MPTITARTLKSIKPKSASYYLRDSKVTGFGVKVYPSGTIKYIAEVRHEGKSFRKTLGAFPILPASIAKRDALSFINKVRQGKLKDEKKQQSLGQIFEDYLTIAKLKPNTVKNYKHVILFYLSDWINKPINKINKDMVEKRFFAIKDIGINGGKPTFSQAISCMRYPYAD